VFDKYGAPDTNRTCGPRFRKPLTQGSFNPLKTHENHYQYRRSCPFRYTPSYPEIPPVYPCIPLRFSLRFLGGGLNPKGRSILRPRLEYGRTVLPSDGRATDKESLEQWSWGDPLIYSQWGSVANTPRRQKDFN